jgi:Domain of unknown function (DUF397)
MEEPVSVSWRKSSYSGNGGGECVEVGAWRKSSYSSNGGGDCVEVGAWRKSSHSGNGGTDCVEVGDVSLDAVLVRDTKDRDGAALAFSAGAWRTFVASLR